MKRDTHEMTCSQLSKQGEKKWEFKRKETET